MKLTYLLPLVLCFGCIVTPKTKTASEILASMNPAGLASVMSLEAPPVEQLTPVTFGWSKVAGAKGYKIYLGGAEDTLTNSVSTEDVDTVIVYVDTVPVFARVVSIDVNGVESRPPSDIAAFKGWERWQDIYAQTNADLVNGQFKDAFPVTSITNQPSNFYRLRIQSKERMLTIPPQ